MSRMLVPVHINYFECVFIFPVQSHEVDECQSSAVPSETPTRSHFLCVSITFFSLLINILPSVRPRSANKQAAKAATFDLLV